MFEKLKELFLVKNEAEAIHEKNHKLEIAACALLLEIAKADENFSEKERNKIIEIVKNNFDLPNDNIDLLFEQTEAAMEKSVSIYEFTDVLNKDLSNDDKYEIVKHLWRIAFVDGQLDKYEDHYIKTIANNLHLHNEERISAKLEVKKELNL